MRIAVPVSQGGMLAEDYSVATTYAVYDVDDRTMAVKYVGRESLVEPECGPLFLRGRGVEVVMGHQVSPEDVQRLAATGILTFTRIAVMPADAVVAHLVSGTLRASPPEAMMHQGCCGGCHGGQECGGAQGEDSACPQDFHTGSEAQHSDCCGGDRASCCPGANPDES